VFLCLGLIVASQSGFLSPVEALLAAPLNFMSGIFNHISLGISKTVTDLAEIQSLRERNAELEEALAKLQAEVVDLREVASDYNRLSDLLKYTARTQNQEFSTADVINIDLSGFLRTIVINKGTRDGIAVGMPVVTGQGLIGRITDVSANAARVLLITDPNSAVSARLQTTRAEGSVIGLDTGGLRMTFIPLGQPIQVGDIVITSGLGGNFPPDIVIGQVTSIRQVEFEVFQEAEVRSLVNFDTLEVVMVITNFQPADLSIFQNPSNP
jgi:rod shape-determining protein MreC